MQISDTHLSAGLGAPPGWAEFVACLHADPPDLVVHSGDIVLENPDDVADRAFARKLIGQLPGPVVVIPGNHDVGGYGPEDARLRARRVKVFVEAWGADRFALDLGGWRVVGANAYLLGDEEHDAWLAAACAGDRPVAVFVHQPLWGDPDDGWAMPAGAATAFEHALAGADVRLVATGHRHCAAMADRGERRSVWAPSLRLLGDVASAGTELRDVDPRPGIVEHTLCVDSSHQFTVHRW